MYSSTPSPRDTGLSCTELFNVVDNSKNGDSPILISLSIVSSPVTSDISDITFLALSLMSLATCSLLNFAP